MKEFLSGRDLYRRKDVWLRRCIGGPVQLSRALCREWAVHVLPCETQSESARQVRGL